MIRSGHSHRCVTSYAEVWIEIVTSSIFNTVKGSPPTRRCGLKSLLFASLSRFCRVTSYAEVWIEIGQKLLYFFFAFVTSYAEVWIEIYTVFTGSRQSRVTSYAEVWIEIFLQEQFGVATQGHLLRGGVD